jgi:hypothetical protein
MEATLHWMGIRTECDPAWNSFGNVYAYAIPKPWELLYVGKTVGCTVRERLNAADKDGFCKWAVRGGIKGFACFVAHPEIVGGKLTARVVHGIERLLIFALQPPGNIQGIAGFDPLPGLVVKITGFGMWPKELHDCGDSVRIIS